jgi:hypothetical protein
MSLSVEGGQHAIIGPLLAGRYEREGSHHGQPIFKKGTQALEVVLYYWDARDGVRFQGWWFGPRLTQEMVWAFCPCQAAGLPPKTGWQLPALGPVDSSFDVFMDVPTPPPPSVYMSIKSVRTNRGGDRIKKKQFSPDDHPLVRKRKADAAVNSRGGK